MRIRIIYAKTAALRYTGGLDMQRSWERSLRRAKLPIAYSNGFHPQPRINQASTLPLGFTSRAEMVDIWLSDALPIAEISAKFSRAVPPGIEVIEILEVPPQEPSVQTITTSVEYQAVLNLPILSGDLQERVDCILQAGSLPRERRNKPYDLRPLIEDVRVVSGDPGSHPCLWMRLSARENATGRPDEVLDELGIPLGAARIERTRLILSS
jgi:radical SAM-linked protein